MADVYTNVAVNIVLCMAALNHVGHVACMGVIRNAYRTLFGKLVGKRLIRRHGY
jgi:hypothetical protein